MSHALCIMAGFLASRALWGDDDWRAFASYIAAAICLIAAAAINLKLGQ